MENPYFKKYIYFTELKSVIKHINFYFFLKKHFTQTARFACFSKYELISHVFYIPNNSKVSHSHSHSRSRSQLPLQFTVKAALHHPFERAYDFVHVCLWLFLFISFLFCLSFPYFFFLVNLLYYFTFYMYNYNLSYVNPFYFFIRINE